MKKFTAYFAIFCSAIIVMGCSSPKLTSLKNKVNSANNTVSDLVNTINPNASTISSFENWKSTIDNATDNLEDSITLKISNYDEETYKLEKLGYYALTVKSDGTILGSTATITYTFDYRSNFKLYRAVKNNKLYEKLNDTEKNTLEFFKNVKFQIITDFMTDYEKELAIHDYIVKNFKYVSGEEKERYYDVNNFVNEKVGYCEAYAYSFAILATMSGIDNEIIFGSVDNVNHAWNAVKLDGEYYYIDTTFDDGSEDSNKILYDFFNLNDTTLAKTHVWDKARNKNLTATGTKYNYFIYNKSYFITLSALESFILQKVDNRENDIAFYIDGYELTNNDVNNILSKKSAVVSGYSILGDMDKTGGFVLTIKYR